MTKRKPVIKVLAKSRGLPAKSYMYILTFDYLLRQAISYVINTELFNYYLSSLVGWKKRHKNRERFYNEYVNYLACYDDSERIEYLLNSRFFLRSKLMEFFSTLYVNINKYKALLEKNPETLTQEEFNYLFMFQFKLGQENESIVRNIPQIFKELRNLLEVLIQNYTAFIIKGLMQRRKGEKNPDQLRTDAFEVLLTMIDSYNTKKSKVTFAKYLSYFIKAGKNTIIKRQSWNLEPGKIVSIEDLERDDEAGFDKDEKHGHPSRPNLEDTISQIISNQMMEIYKHEEYKSIIDKLHKYLPKPLYDVMALEFELVDPLTPDEEIKLILGGYANVST